MKLEVRDRKYEVRRRNNGSPKTEVKKEKRGEKNRNLRAFVAK